MHTQAQQPHHLSCCWEETGTALSWSVTGGVGWVNKVHVPMPAHAQQPCVKELGWSSVREHESSSTKCHTKAALERVELCEMSWVRWVVWDELCDLWDERSCVRWNVCIVWDNLSEVERERSNSGGEGGEGKEYKHKNKSPTQRCEEKNHNLMSCVMMLKKLEEESCYRATMTKSHNKNVHRRPTVWRAQTTHFWRAQTTPQPNVNSMQQTLRMAFSKEIFGHHCSCKYYRLEYYNSHIETHEIHPELV